MSIQKENTIKEAVIVSLKNIQEELTKLNDTASNLLNSLVDYLVRIDEIKASSTFEGLSIEAILFFYGNRSRSYYCYLLE